MGQTVHGNVHVIDPAPDGFTVERNEDYVELLYYPDPYTRVNFSFHPAAWDQFRMFILTSQPKPSEGGDEA